FGERFAQVAESCGKEVVRVMVPEGRTLEPEHLARFLDGPEVDAVALVHCESATGALAPLEALAKIARQHRDVMVLVDAVTSVGGMPVETDAWGLDFVFTGSQKALALPPGLALGVASPRFIERAAKLPGRGWYLDPIKLLESARTALPLQTPAISLIYALACQLERIERTGGLEARWHRHREMQAIVERWCDAHAGCTLLAPPGRRSPTISAVRLPPGLTASAAAAALAKDGWSVTSGLPPLAESVIRIGHMGDAVPERLDEMLAALGALVALV
nr:alanine--glyoxylate aminotransferase family protein [Gemmatimonadales bacterium]